MSIFERVIPLPERVRWQMLKAALNSGTTAGTIAKRLGWPLYKVNRLVMAIDPLVKLRDVAEWAFATYGEDASLKFKLITHP